MNTLVYGRQGENKQLAQNGSDCGTRTCATSNTPITICFKLDSSRPFVRMEGRCCPQQTGRLVGAALLLLATMARGGRTKLYIAHTAHRTPPRGLCVRAGKYADAQAEHFAHVQDVRRVRRGIVGSETRSVFGTTGNNRCRKWN
jgi:hypothetical protein